jgi:secondary thiamine-phosphate synthase enzyme
MLVHTDYLHFNTKQKQEFIRITDEVAAIVKAGGVHEGIVLVSAMHITSGVRERLGGGPHPRLPGVAREARAVGARLPPSSTGEDNADAHLKRTIMGHQVILPITKGTLDLGPWEQVFYAEFDGQRRKRVVVKVMGLGAGG